MTAPVIFEPGYYQRMRDLERTGWWNAGMRDIAAALLARAQLPPRGRVVDVGCGTGQTLAWLQAMYPACDLLGLDVSPHALAVARTVTGVRVLAATALDLPLATASADLVLTLDVLQHLPLDGGDARALGEIARVLRPDGWLLLRTNAQAFPRTADDPDASFHRYELGELRAKLTRAGLGVVHAGRVNAVMGLAEIPREFRAARRHRGSYHGLLAAPRVTQPWWGVIARRILRAEGALARAGWPVPWGRTIVAICRRIP